jgi:hypothetical protein
MVADVGLVAIALTLYGAGPGDVVGCGTVAIGVLICAFNAELIAITTIVEA